MPSGSRGSVRTTSGSPHGQRWATSATPRASPPELSGDRVEVGLRDGRQVGTCGHRRAPGASAVRVDCQTVSYQGSGVSGAATSGTGSLVPVAGSASSTV